MAQDPIKTSTFEEQFKKSANKAEQNLLPKLYNDAEFGKAQNFSAKQSNLAKYVTYGSEIYGKLGFDPRKNMDDLYHDNTTSADEMSRAWRGAYKLAKIGFQDTVALGAFSSKNNYLDFADITASYYSTRKGTEFWANTLVSAGYTGGIIFGIAAEEAALAAITAASGFGAAPMTALEGAGVIGRGLERYSTAHKYLNAIQNLTDLNKATQWLGRAGTKTKKFLTTSESLNAFAKALNPLENTIDFIKEIDSIKDFNSLKQVAIGAGTIVRDARKITMSHSEAKLEADLAKKEFKENQIDLFRRNPENAGKEIPQEFFNDLERRAEEVRAKTYAGNFGLIYLTNAITFDNMTKNMKAGSAHFINNFKLSNIAKKGGKQVTVDVLKQGIIRPAFRELKTLATRKGATRFIISSSMEGIQELGQDAISNANKKYFGYKDIDYNKPFDIDNYDPTISFQIDKTRGGFFDALFNEYVESTQNLYSKEGLTTFLSGALMGIFANPVGYATGRLNSYVSSGGLGKTYERTFDNKSWNKKRTAVELELKEKAKILTKFFNEQGSFVDSANHPLFNQIAEQEEMLTAIVNNDEKKLKDSQNLSFVKGLKTLFQNNMEDEFSAHLSYMADKFGPEELNEIFGRTDITKDNQKEYKQKLLDRVEKIKEYKVLYDEINNSVVNPIDISQLDINDPLYMDKLMEHKAYEELKDELLFSGATIKDAAVRLKELKSDLIKNLNLSSLEIDSIVDSKSLTSQIELLESQVKGNKDLKLTGLLQKDALLTEEKLNAFKQYEKALNTYKKIYNSEDPSGIDEAFDDLFDAYHSIVKLSSVESNLPEAIQRAQNRKTFDKVFDYISLGEESTFNQNFLNMLNTPGGRSSFLQAKREALIKYDANKEQHIYNSLLAFEKSKLSDQMLDELSKSGIFFDLNDLDELVSKGIMPSRIYDLETSKPATTKQEKIAQEIVSKFYKKLTGKKIIDASKAPSQAVKRANDKRTLKGILRAYGVVLNKVYDLASEKGPASRIIDTALSSSYITSIDKEILLKLIDVKVKIKFVNDAELPVHIDEDGVIVMDLRFASSDYTGGILAFEHLIVTGLTQQKLIDSLKENKSLLIDAENAMQSAKEAFAKNNYGVDVNKLPIFNDVSLFLSESLNDIAFQKFLGSINDSLDGNDVSLWKTLTDDIKKIVNSFVEKGEELEFEKKLINRVFNIATKALSIAQVEEVVGESDSVVEEMIVTPTESTNEPSDQIESDKQTELEQLTEKLDVLTKEYNRLKASIEAGLSFIKATRIKSKLRSISIEIIDINEKINDLKGVVAEINQSVEEEYVPTYDIYGNEVITDQTPWQSIPKDLRNVLAMLLDEGELNSLNSDQVQTIRENMKSNPVYISAVNDYVQKIQTAEEFRLSEEIRLLNQEAIDKSKQNKAPTLRSVKSKIKYTDEDIIRGILKDLDYSVLTPAEISNLVSKLKEKNQAIPFGPEDIISFVKEKIYKQSISEIIKNEKNAKVKRANIVKNLKLINGKSVKWLAGKKVKSLRISESTRKFIKAYHPEIFELNTEEFISKIRSIVNEKKQLLTLKYADGIEIFSNDKDISTQVLDLFNSLEESNTLFPEVVKNINRALYKANSAIRIKIKSRGKYSIGVKSPSEIRDYKKFPKNEYAKKKEVVIDQAEYNSTAAIVDWLLNHKIHPDAIISLYGVDAKAEIKSRQSLLSVNSKYKTIKGIADAIHDNVIKLNEEGEITPDGTFKADYDFETEVEEMLQNYSSIVEMVNYAYSIIEESNNTPNEEEDVSDFFENFYDTDEGNSYLEKRAKDEADYILFLNSEEGAKASEDQKSAEQSYHKSKAFEIETGTYTGDFEELTDDEQRALSYARSIGFYQDVYIDELAVSNSSLVVDNKANTSPIETIKEQLLVTANNYSTAYNHLRAVVSDLTTVKQNDIAFAAGVYAFLNSSKALTDKNKQMATLAIINNFKKGTYDNTFVVLNEKVYQILSFNDGAVSIQNLKSHEITETPVLTLLEEIQQSLNEGEFYNNINALKVVNNQEIVYIKSIYQDIFNNFDNAFNALNTEAENKISDDKLLELLTKCK